MSLRKRSGNWHSRFEYKKQEYTGNTDLADTPQNKREAVRVEAEALEALKKGRPATRSIEVISFRDAVAKFLSSGRGSLPRTSEQLQADQDKPFQFARLHEQNPCKYDQRCQG